MAQKKDFNTMILEKKATLDVLEQLMVKLGDIEDYARKEWGIVGTKQKTKWSDDQGKSLPVYLDECGNETFDITATPKIVDDYDYVEKEEFTEKDKAMMSAIEKIRDTLANLA